MVENWENADFDEGKIVTFFKNLIMINLIKIKINPIRKSWRS